MNQESLEFYRFQNVKCWLLMAKKTTLVTANYTLKSACAGSTVSISFCSLIITQAGECVCVYVSIAKY